MTYSRAISFNIEKMLFKKKALIITGARQVGKTTLITDLIKKINKPMLFLNADEFSVRNIFMEPTIEKIKKIISGHKVVIIDEIQRIENPGLLLKLMVDNFKEVQFIATGSSLLEISDKTFEPLTGRHFLYHLYPFSFSELYDGDSPYQIRKELPFHMIYGLYPDICINREDAEIYLKNLTSQYLYKDVLSWKDIRKPDLLDKLLQLLAHQMCSEVSLHELAMQLKVKTETVDTYIDLLEKSFVVYRLSSFSSNERKEVSKMKKILFWDNGIRNAIIGDFRPLSNRNDAGCLWENLMITERIKMNSWMEKSKRSYFWRSRQQQEVDYVELETGHMSGFEMKWNTLKHNYVTKAFTNLYPDAKTKLITPGNFEDFCYL